MKLWQILLLLLPQIRYENTYSYQAYLNQCANEYVLILLGSHCKWINLYAILVFVFAFEFHMRIDIVGVGIVAWNSCR